MLISEKLTKAIHEQIAHEKYNANLYLYIAGCLRNKGLDNVAKFFLQQHEEETGHALEFFNLLTDLNVDVMIPQIPEANIPFNSMLDIAKVYLRQEVKTTVQLIGLKDQCIEEANGVVEEKMREMIAKQQHEYEEACSFMDKATLMPEWWQWVIYDGSLK